MNLKVNGIDHLNVEVINLNKTVEFYNQLFGFTVIKEQPQENSKIIGNEKVKLCLYETEDFHGYTKKRISSFWITY